MGKLTGPSHVKTPVPAATAAVTSPLTFVKSICPLRGRSHLWGILSGVLISLSLLLGLTGCVSEKVGHC